MKTKNTKPKPKTTTKLQPTEWSDFFHDLDIATGDLIVVPIDLVDAFCVRLNKAGFSRKKVECDLVGHVGIKVTGMLADRQTTKDKLLGQLAALREDQLTAVVAACKKQGLLHK